MLVLIQPLIITVEENETVLNDTPDKLGIEVVCFLIFLHPFPSFCFPSFRCSQKNFNEELIFMAPWMIISVFIPVLPKRKKRKEKKNKMKAKMQYFLTFLFFHCPFEHPSNLPKEAGSTYHDWDLLYQ
jgi:hypothetical protein